MTIERTAGGIAVVRVGAEAGSWAETLERDLLVVERDELVRGVVIDPRAISGRPAGAHLEELLSIKTAKGGRAIALAGRSVVEKLAALSKPTVALLEGPILGAAFEVALACDRRVAAADATTTVGLSEVHLGLVPALSGLERLATLAGIEAAIELGLSGDPIPASEAESLGLVDMQVPVDVLQAAAVEAAVAASKTDLRERRGRIDQMRLQIVERNPLLQRMLLRRAAARLGGHDKAKRAALDVLEAFVANGENASKELGLRLFGELCVSAASGRLIEVMLDEEAASKTKESPKPFDEHLFVGRIERALALAIGDLQRDGVSLSAIDEALFAWGFSIRVSSISKTSEQEKSRLSRNATRLVVEEIQLRVVLSLLLAVVSCMDEGIVPSSQAADLLVLSKLGFPRFRGGPLRYIDTIGADEILKRAQNYEARLGESFQPPQGLRNAAQTGVLFHRREEPLPRA